MDGKSNKTLKAWYTKINKRFFLGELPSNVIVRWADPGEEKDIAGTSRATNPRHSYVILLNREKISTQSIKLSTLLHEMIHVATFFKDYHGAAFEEWRVRLGERGAFLKNALIKGQTLF